MAGGFRTRAASLLRSSVHDEEPKSKSKSEAQPTNEKDPRDVSLPRSSTEKTSHLQGDVAVKPDNDANRIIRTMPVWVHSRNEDDENLEPTSQSISQTPSVPVAQHNSSPSRKSKHRGEPPRGRLHDLQREWAPPIPSTHISEHAGQWREYMRTSVDPSYYAQPGTIMTGSWVARNGPDYSLPWVGCSKNGDTSKASKKSWWERLRRTILRSPVVPLVIRTTVWVFSVVALALGNSIVQNTGELLKKNFSAIAPEIHYSSPYMAIIVDAVALVYTLYITYDEYTGKPLGLRPAKEKMRLIFLDLIFIVFNSANLSLAFKAVVEPTNYDTTDKESNKIRTSIEREQKALASVLLVVLLAWLTTFTISMLRLVERVKS